MTGIVALLGSEGKCEGQIDIRRSRHWALLNVVIRMISTDRLLLSDPTSSDREALMRFQTDPAVRVYLGGAVSEETATSSVNSLLNREKSNYAWVVRDRAIGTIYGLVTIDSHHDGGDLELSYQLFPEYQGYGYATEALVSVVDCAFNTLGLSRIISETQMVNLPSRRLLERIGMLLERKVIRFGVEQGIYSLSAPSRSSLI